MKTGENENRSQTKPESDTKGLNSSKTIILNEDTFDCPLCQQLLYEPIATSCGHTFCKSCILRAMDHDNKCPLCRTVVHISPEHGICILLQQLIQ